MSPRLHLPALVRVAASVALTLALAACGPAPSPRPTPTVVPVIINGPGQLVCGPNRILFTLLDRSDTPVGSPDRTASIAIYDLAQGQPTAAAGAACPTAPAPSGDVADWGSPVATVDGTFVWAIENERGIYIANASFAHAGRYGAEVSTTKAGVTETQRLTFDVQPSSPVIGVGDKAPASKTPTLTDVGGDVSHISTDADPDPALYQTSVDEALADHKPFVLIFATPKFCTSAQCGPTLDSIKPFVARYPTVTFINVEPYKLKLVDGVLQADLDANGQLQATGVTDEWHLLTEPTVYVVDRDGVVTAHFDLIFSDAELTGAIDAVK